MVKHNSKYKILGLIMIMMSCHRVKDPCFPFELLSPEDTGVGFVNTLTESDDFNIIDYLYYYNGAGVGVADFNQNGWQDLFFTSNEGSCKLYLNKGDFVFEDLTERAGLSTDFWATGVSIADINGDGLQDIYICAAGYNDPKRRKNRMFVHQGFSASGTPFFKEMGEEMGIADTAHSTQALFFDYNMDGLLDLYVMNHANEREKVNTPLPLNLTTPQASNDRLYKNNGDGTFSDVTKEAGIIGEGYGLGIVLGDFNRDGWPDIYVANDFIFSDQLWINQQDGTFSNEVGNYFDYQAYNSMGCDLVDFDGDGREDLIVLDMLPEDLVSYKMMAGEMTWYKWNLMLSQGYMPQYMRNMLYRHNGVPAGKDAYSYQEIGQYAGVDASDWSWSPLWLDVNNNGKSDLYITNGYYRDITDQDFTDYNDNLILFSDQETSDEKLLERVRNQPGRHVINHLYAYNSDFKFNRIHCHDACPPSYSNGAVYADLNNDGWLDLVVSNINEPAFILRNTGANRSEASWLQVELEGPGMNKNAIGAEVLVYTKNGAQFKRQSPVRGYQSSVSPRLHFGLGAATAVDSIKVRWPDFTSQTFFELSTDQILTLSYSKEDVLPSKDLNKIANETRFNLNEVYDLFGISEQVLSAVLYDEEPLIPYAYDVSKPLIRPLPHVKDDKAKLLYISNNENDNRIIYKGPGGDWVESLLPGIEAEIADIIFLDVNGNGLVDIVPLLLQKSDNQIESRSLVKAYYSQDASGGFTKSELPDNFFPTSGFKGAALLESNTDTLIYLFAQIIEGKYPMTADNQIWAKSDNKWVSYTNYAPVELIRPNGITKYALWYHPQIGNDPVLFTVGHWMPPLAYQWKNNTFNKVEYFEDLESGWWNYVSTWRGIDGKDYLFLANEGLNYPYVPKADSPLSVFFGDFDMNGRSEAFLTTNVDGADYPIYKRNAFVRKLHGLDFKFPKHRMYAQSSVKKMIDKNRIEHSVRMEATNFRHCLLSLDINGEVSQIDVPSFIHSSPIHKVLVHPDNETLFLFGNDYNKSIWTGYQTGWNIKLLRTSDWQLLPDFKTGLYHRGQLSDALYLDREKGLLVASRQKGLILYEETQQIQMIN